VRHDDKDETPVMPDRKSPGGVGAPAGADIEPWRASMQVEGTRLYRVRDVAEHFDVSVNTIYRAIESGQLKALKLGTRTGTFRVSGSAVLAYAEACMRASYQAWFPGGSSAGHAEDQAIDRDAPELTAVVSHEH
jgi:excisionase family DNA binding protein